jgi:hypothetical protein
MNRFIVSTLTCFLAAGVVCAADAVKSGLDIGEGTTAFNVRDVTGPSKGKTLCYRCQYGAKPVTAIFTREITPEVAALVKQIDNTVAANADKNACAFVVLLTDDADAGAKQLEKLAADQKITKTPLTVFDGAAGPEKYKIAKDAAVTVMMWNKSRVAVNHAFPTAKLSDDQVKAVAGDTSKILN